MFRCKGVRRFGLATSIALAALIMPSAAGAQTVGPVTCTLDYNQGCAVGPVAGFEVFCGAMMDPTYYELRGCRVKRGTTQVDCGQAIVGFFSYRETYGCRVVRDGRTTDAGCFRGGGSWGEDFGCNLPGIAIVCNRWIYGDDDCTAVLGDPADPVLRCKLNITHPAQNRPGQACTRRA